MQTARLTISILFLTLFSQFSSAQGIDPETNWLQPLDLIYCGYDTIWYTYSDYSKEDVQNAKQTLASLRSATDSDIWAGPYYSNTGIGDSYLILDEPVGYVSFYCYHGLKNLDYGEITSKAGRLNLKTKKSTSGQVNEYREAMTKDLIKVRFGERRFLVPRMRVQDFLTDAAGLHVNSSDIFYYWIHEKDMRLSSFGIPDVPNEFRHFIRKPIEVSISEVDVGSVSPDEYYRKDGLLKYADLNVPISINTGTNSGIKVGMDFYVDALGEWFEITRVRNNTSDGLFKRRLDKFGELRCRDNIKGSGQSTDCKTIKIGMKARTKSRL